MDSAASPSASVILATNAASYRRFRHASARLAQTDRLARRPWSVSEYASSRGNPFDASNQVIAASNAVRYTSSRV